MDRPPGELYDVDTGSVAIKKKVLTKFYLHKLPAGCHTQASFLLLMALEGEKPDANKVN